MIAGVPLINRGGVPFINSITENIFSLSDKLKTNYLTVYSSIFLFTHSFRLILQAAALVRSARSLLEVLLTIGTAPSESPSHITCGRSVVGLGCASPPQMVQGVVGRDNVCCNVK